MGSLVVAERRRRIYNALVQNGFAQVRTLTEQFGVGISTIRNDLDTLEGEGKLVRVHGGAMPVEEAKERPPYLVIVATFLAEKSWIGRAALAFLPEAGTIMIDSGSTTIEMVKEMRPNPRLRLVTNSLPAALHLASNGIGNVDILGGAVRAECLDTECDEGLETCYWDAAFIGAAALDTQRGITALDRRAARFDSTIIEHSRKVVVLCDSSKIGKWAYVQVEPVQVIHVLITDKNIDPAIAESLRSLGVEVVTAGPPDEAQ